MHWVVKMFGLQNLADFFKGDVVDQNGAEQSLLRPQAFSRRLIACGGDRVIDGDRSDGAKGGKVGDDFSHGGCTLADRFDRIILIYLL